MSPEVYFKLAAPSAMDQARKYKIPPSVTLAQGAMESGWAESYLAVNGNNHFGIKCGPDWKGPGLLLNDDRPNECFRVYNSIAESFEDHSKFLHKYSRYNSLFDLPFTDYKGWFKGLQAAGYGTDPNMATKLIAIVEKYGLDKYDKKIIVGRVVKYVLISLLILVVFMLILLAVKRTRKNNTK